MPSQTELTGESDLDNWQRVSPAAVITNVGGVLRGMISQWPVILAAGVGLFSAMDMASIALVLILALVATVGYAIAAWLRFRYRLEDERLVLERGVFQHEQVSVEFDRIQNVQIEQPFYARWFSVVTLGIETAGSSGRELSIPGLTEVRASALNRQVAASRRVVGAHPEGSADEYKSVTADAGEEAGEIHLRHHLRDVAIYGLTNVNVLIFFVAVGAFSQFVDDDAWKSLDPEPLLALWHQWAGNSLLADSLLLITGLLLLLGLLTAATVVTAVLKYHDYTMSSQDNEITRRSGLLTTREQNLKRAKIRAVEIRQSAIGRLLGRFDIRLHQTRSVSDATAQMTGKDDQTFIVPGLTASQVDRLVPIIEPDLEISQLRFQRPARRQIISVLIASGLILVGPTIGFSMGLSPWAGLLWPAGMLFMAAIAYQRWRRFGLAAKGQFGGVASGLIGSKRIYFPIRELHSIDFSESPFQRRRGLTTITFHLPSDSLTFPYARDAVARPLRDGMLHLAESHAA